MSPSGARPTFARHRTYVFFATNSDDRRLARIVSHQCLNHAERISAYRRVSDRCDKRSDAGSNKADALFDREDADW